MKSKENSMSVKKSITDKSGFSKIQWCILLVVLALIMAFILSYVVAVNIAQSQKKIATQALDAFVEDNAIRIYSEVKQNSDYTEELLEDEFLKKLVETNGLEAYGTDKYVCKSADGRNTQYVITKPEMDFEEDYSAKVIIEYIISVPLEFNGRPAIWVDIPITVTSRFMPKYEAEEEQKDSDDRTPPSITISIPSGTTESNPFVTPYDTVTIMGSVYDQELAMVAVAGDRISVTEGGAFKQIIDLQDGMNVIPVVATDRMGNTSTKYVYVSKEGVIPLDVTVEGYSGVYDGNPHSITVTCAQNAIITYSATEGGSYTNVNPTFTNAGTYRVYYRVEKEGYGTVQNSALVEIGKADNVLNANFKGSPISNTTYSIGYPVTENITIERNLSGGTISVTSNNTSRITVSGSGNQYSVTTLNNSGDASITIVAAETTNYKEARIVLSIRVTGCTHPSVETERSSSATCTTAGYTGDIYCSVCRDLLETGTSVAALGHNYAEKNTGDTYLRTSASCTAAATYYYKCTRCTSKGPTYWTSGTVAGHSWTAAGTQKDPASCTKGSTNWKKCSACGTQSSTEYWTNNDALGHDYSQQGSLVSYADCYSAAVYYKKCSRCSSQSGTMSVGNALGHDYSQQGSLVSYADCYSAAVYYKKCSRCSSQSGTMSVGNALGHAWNAATCTNPATCSRCGTTSGYANGHTKGGSCVCVGNTWSSSSTHHQWTCTVCGGTFLEEHSQHPTEKWHWNDQGYHFTPCAAVKYGCWRYWNYTAHTLSNGVCTVCGWPN